MSISSTTSRNDYTGNGSTAAYSYAFKIFSKSDLVVAVRDLAGVVTLLVVDTDFTVAGVGVAAGGTITLIAGNLTTGYKLCVRRKRALTQQTDIRNQGDYFPEVIEDTFDMGVMNDQGQQDEVDRSFKLPETYKASDFDPTFPAALIGAVSYLVATDVTGTKLAKGPAVSDLTTAVTAAAAASASAAAASTSATAAAASATAAGTSATAAASSATAAAGSATAAAASAAAAAASSGAAPRVTGTLAVPIAITAAGGITPTNTLAGLTVWDEIIFVKGNGGPVTITANPKIAAGVAVGQKLSIYGTDDTNTLTIANGTGDSENGDVILGQDDYIEYVWNGTTWSERNRRR